MPKTDLDIRVVTSIPTQITPSTMYMLLVDDGYVSFMTDKTGTQLVPQRSIEVMNNLDDLMLMGVPR
jgi:hypothetical protein